MINVRDVLDSNRFFGSVELPSAEWRISDTQIGYADSVATMEARVAAIASGSASEQIWLLEHPPLYTAGTSAKVQHAQSATLPVFQSGRGGQVTYHGPGQRVAYIMLDLKSRKPDVRAYVSALEEMMIRTLAAFNIRGERRQDRVGVWVKRPDKGRDYEDKIGAIGVRIKRWVTMHGLSLNVDPDLAHFAGIVPCGVDDPRYGVTSLADLGLTATMTDVDLALRESFHEVFGPTVNDLS